MAWTFFSLSSRLGLADRLPRINHTRVTYSVLSQTFILTSTRCPAYSYRQARKIQTDAASALSIGYVDLGVGGTLSRLFALARPTLPPAILRPFFADSTGPSQADSCPPCDSVTLLGQLCDISPSRTSIFTGGMQVTKVLANPGRQPARAAVCFLPSAVLHPPSVPAIRWIRQWCEVVVADRS